MKKVRTLLNSHSYATINEEVKMKLSRADVQMIELRDRIKLSIEKENKGKLKELLKKYKPLSVRKVKFKNGRMS